jgi:hypothetical protein
MMQSGRGARPFLVTMSIWLILAIVLGARDRLTALEPPLPQVIIGALTLTLVLAGALNPGLRDWLARVNLRGFVAFHLTRFVGIVFLMMHARGQLDGRFALSAGWGDIVAAIGALLIVLLLPDPLAKPRLLFVWNAYGLADILSVVVTAARLGVSEPASIAPLLHFPMSLVPTFVVPIIIASHVLVFWRLRRTRPASS